MMDKPEIGLGEDSPLRLRVHSQFRERELSRLPPEFDGSIDFRRPEEVGLLRRLWRFRNDCSRVVHVVTADLVLCAVSTVEVSVIARALPTCAHTIVGMFHRSGYASSCMFCILYGIWYGCASKGRRRVLPFGLKCKRP
jgi:hypothetical protein